MHSESDTSPRILAFCCMYCAYAAADAAGSLRLSYSPSVEIVLVPCSGRVSILDILRALEHGADGVLVAGCEEGSCHFSTGNFRAKKRVEYVRKLLEEIGIEPERVQMHHVSASQGVRFREIVQKVTDEISRLGVINWNKKY